MIPVAQVCACLMRHNVKICVKITIRFIIAEFKSDNLFESYDNNSILQNVFPKKELIMEIIEPQNGSVKPVNTIDRKDFMKQVGLGFGAIMLLNCLQSCSGSEIPDPDPDPGTTGKDFTVDFSSGTNAALKTKGGFAVVQGVIIARTLSDTFIAVSAVCTHEGSIINYRPSSNDFLCPNHLSEFSDTGAVKKGPATTALKKYNHSVDLNANTIRIFE